MGKNVVACQPWLRYFPPRDEKIQGSRVVEDATATTDDAATSPLLLFAFVFSLLICNSLETFPSNLSPSSLCIYSVSIRRADYVYWMSLRCSRVDKGEKGSVYRIVNRKGTFRLPVDRADQSSCPGRGPFTLILLSPKAIPKCSRDTMFCMGTEDINHNREDFSCRNYRVASPIPLENCPLVSKFPWPGKI